MDTFVPRKREGGMIYQRTDDVGSDDTVASVIYPKPKKSRRRKSVHPLIMNTYDLESKHCLIVHVFYACMLQLATSIAICIHAVTLLIYQYSKGNRLIEGKFPNVFTYCAAGIILFAAAVCSCLTHNVHRRQAPANAITAIGLMLIGIALLIATIILSYFLAKWREGPVKAELQHHLSSYKTQDTFWDTLQKEGKCCGVTSKDDWSGNNFTIPLSCCKTKINTNELCKEWYDRGCFPVKYRLDVAHHYHLVGVSSAVIFALVPAFVIMVIAYLQTSKEQKLEERPDYRLPSIREMFSRQQCSSLYPNLRPSLETKTSDREFAPFNAGSTTNFHAEVPPHSAVLAVYQPSSWSSLANSEENKLRSKQRQSHSVIEEEDGPSTSKAIHQQLQDKNASLALKSTTSPDNESIKDNAKETKNRDDLKTKIKESNGEDSVVSKSSFNGEQKEKPKEVQKKSDS